MVKVKIEQFRAAPTPLTAIGNGTFFTGSIDGSRTMGPWLKVGSVGMGTWVVVRLENMQGLVYVSRRDDMCSVADYQPLTVREVVLRSHESPVSVDAVDPSADIRESGPRA